MLYRMKIAYDGTNYAGFQIQPHHKTIQGVLEKMLTRLYGKPIRITSAGRTDAGVHAEGQVVTFEVDRCVIPLEKMQYVFNCKLPEDIVVHEVHEVEATFHPRYDAKEKTYHYLILNSELRQPKQHNYAYFFDKQVDVEKMKEAAQYFLGTHDFIGFSSAGGSVKTTVRTIYAIEVEREEQWIHIRVRGNGFLYNMVRIMVGTLLQAGVGTIEPCYIETILQKKVRGLAGSKVPPNGLTLVKIEY